MDAGTPAEYHKTIPGGWDPGYLEVEELFFVTPIRFRSNPWLLSAM